MSIQRAKEFCLDCFAYSGAVERYRDDNWEVNSKNAGIYLLRDHARAQTMQALERIGDEHLLDICEKCSFQDPAVYKALTGN